MGTTMQTPLRIGTMVLKNRLVMTPMNTNYSDAQGCLTPQMEEYYVRRAKGGVGLMVLEAAAVTPDTRNHGVQPMLYDEKFVPAWSNLIERLQSYGTKVSIELAHFGSEATLEPRASASDVSRFPDARVEVLSKERIAEIQDAFVRTAQNAKMAGADAITLHAAHGYLLAEFLSPLYNRRTDEYGGSLENRMRFLTELLAKLRRTLGDRYPIFVRYSVDEFVTGGRDAKESEEVAVLLERGGASGIDLSAGVPNTYTFTNPPNGLGDTACMLIEKAAAVKRRVKIPVICANSIRYPSEIAEILAQGKVDLIGLARPLLADPDFPRKALEGRDGEIRPCLSCQHCFRTLDSGRSLRCAVNPETGREYANPPLHQPRKRLLVIGGGPAGMEAARTAALAGHEVILCEKESRLGGALLAAAIPPNKGKIAELVQWFERELERLGVRIYRNTEATKKWIEACRADRVICACGADYLKRIAGSDRENVCNVAQALLHPQTVGRDVVIIGGGASGCEAAEYFSGERVTLRWKGKDGVAGPLIYDRIVHEDRPEEHTVSLVEMLPDVAGDMDEFNKELMRVTLKEKNVRIFAGARVLEITAQGVRLLDRDGEEQLLKADTVILAAGLSPRTCEAVPNAACAGDSVKPGRIGDATYSAYALTRHIFEEG